MAYAERQELGLQSMQVICVSTSCSARGPPVDVPIITKVFPALEILFLVLVIESWKLFEAGKIIFGRLVSHSSVMVSQVDLPSSCKLEI